MEEEREGGVIRKREGRANVRARGSEAKWGEEVDGRSGRGKKGFGAHS